MLIVSSLIQRLWNFFSTTMSPHNRSSASSSHSYSPLNDPNYFKKIPPKPSMSAGTEQTITVVKRRVTTTTTGDAMEVIDLEKRRVQKISRDGSGREIERLEKIKAIERSYKGSGRSLNRLQSIPEAHTPESIADSQRGQERRIYTNAGSQRSRSGWESQPRSKSGFTAGSSTASQSTLRPARPPSPRRSSRSGSRTADSTIRARGEASSATESRGDYDDLRSLKGGDSLSTYEFQRPPPRDGHPSRPSPLALLLRADKIRRGSEVGSHW